MLKDTLTQETSRTIISLTVSKIAVLQRTSGYTRSELFWISPTLLWQGLAGQVFLKPHDTLLPRCSEFDRPPVNCEEECCYGGLVIKFQRQPFLFFSSSSSRKSINDDVWVFTFNPLQFLPQKSKTDLSNTTEAVSACLWAKITFSNEGCDWIQALIFTWPSSHLWILLHLAVGPQALREMVISTSALAVMLDDRTGTQRHSPKRLKFDSKKTSVDLCHHWFPRSSAIFLIFQSPKTLQATSSIPVLTTLIVAWQAPLLHTIACRISKRNLWKLLKKPTRSTFTEVLWFWHEHGTSTVLGVFWPTNCIKKYRRKNDTPLKQTSHGILVYVTTALRGVENVSDIFRSLKWKFWDFCKNMCKYHPPHFSKKKWMVFLHFSHKTQPFHLQPLRFLCVSSSLASWRDISMFM